MYTTDPFHLVVETGLHLEELTVPDRSTLAHGSDAGKSVLGTTEESNDESLVAGDLEAVRVLPMHGQLHVQRLCSTSQLIYPPDLCEP